MSTGEEVSESVGSAEKVRAFMWRRLLSRYRGPGILKLIFGPVPEAAYAYLRNLLTSLQPL